MAQESAESHQYVTFCLGSELFGVEVSRAREILTLVSITKVPQTPDYLLGVINLRGQVVPVVDLRVKLGLPTVEITQESCILVMEVQLDGETIVAGGLADSAREVLELRDDLIEPPPRLGMHLNVDYVAGMGKLDEQFVILLNLDRIFSAGEVSELQAANEEALAAV